MGRSSNISLSIKEARWDIFENLLKLKPDGISLSAFMFVVFEDFIKRSKEGIVNFYQSPTFWAKYLEECSEEEYKKFYQQLDLLNKIERIKTGERLR